MSAKHTPGPWAVSKNHDYVFGRQQGAGLEPLGFVYGPSFGEQSVVGMRAMADTRLIAAAPDYHEAADWIRQAVANNAAPVNPIAALEEMALNGQHITLDAGLVLDLLKAHAKATGEAAS